VNETSPGPPLTAAGWSALPAVFAVVVTLAMLRANAPATLTVPPPAPAFAVAAKS
jgi:hypothetical protein